LQLIDTHCHLDDPRFYQNRDQIIQQAKACGINAQIIPATTATSWPRIKHICEQYPKIYPSYGLHPFFIDQLQSTDLETLQQWLATENPVALGECGLDYLKTRENKKEQQALFEAQLVLASKFKLPIIIHANRAVEDVISFIKQSQHHQGVIHSYNGSWQQAKLLIDLGYKISIGGAATYPKALKIREIVQKCPLECLMIETDAPDQPPINYKGGLNTPAYLMDVFKVFCELRKEPPEALASALNNNATKLFQLAER